MSDLASIHNNWLNTLNDLCQTRNTLLQQAKLYAPKMNRLYNLQPGPSVKLTLPAQLYLFALMPFAFIPLNYFANGTLLPLKDICLIIAGSVFIAIIITIIIKGNIIYVDESGMRYGSVSINWQDVIDCRIMEYYSYADKDQSSLLLLTQNRGAFEMNIRPMLIGEVSHYICFYATGKTAWAKYVSNE